MGAYKFRLNNTYLCNYIITEWFFSSTEKHFMIQHRYEAATIADGNIWHLSWISISSSLRLLLMEPRSHLLTPGMLKFWNRHDHHHRHYQPSVWSVSWGVSFLNLINLIVHLKASIFHTKGTATELLKMEKARTIFYIGISENY